MDKEFVPYQQSLDMKELGFDEDCFKYWYAENQAEIPYLTYTVYGGELYEQDFNILFEGDEIQVSAPTFSQAFDWFREKHGLHSHVRESLSFDGILGFVSQINGNYVNHGIKDKPINRFETHKEAQLACLVDLISIIKNKKL